MCYVIDHKLYIEHSLFCFCAQGYYYYYNVHDFIAHTVFLGAMPAAARFYERIGYAYPFFAVCNDATAVRAAVTCRLKDNVLLGLATLRDVRCGSPSRTSRSSTASPPTWTCIC